MAKLPKLTPNGDVITKAGEAFGAYRPIAPPHVDRSRQSHNVYASEPTETAYFYGLERDIGTPGYHVFPIVPAAPSLRQDGLPAFLPTKPVDPREKAATTWGALKRQP